MEVYVILQGAGYVISLSVQLGNLVTAMASNAPCHGVCLASSMPSYNLPRYCPSQYFWAFIIGHEDLVCQVTLPVVSIWGAHTPTLSKSSFTHC